MAEIGPEAVDGAGANDPQPDGIPKIEQRRLHVPRVNRANGPATKTILIIEDDVATRDVVRFACIGQRLNLVETDTAEQAFDQLEEIDPSLIILDLNLPGASGIDFCRSLRSEKFLCPVIMLTARSDTIDIVVGLEVGADDYMTKPFAVRELLARIWAHLRRVEQGLECPPKGFLEFPGLRVNLDSRQVWRDGAEVVLTLTEFNLLSELASQAGHVLSRGELLRKVWGYEVEIETRTVDAHIFRLRKKIESGPDRPHFIQGVAGIGYRFAAP